MMVFGAGWECVKNFVDPQKTEATHLSHFGHKVTFVEVETLSSSARNASLIREAVMAMPEPEADRRLVLWVTQRAPRTSLRQSPPFRVCSKGLQRW